MTDWKDIRLPEGFDWAHWVRRWDRMQARYLVRRGERFAILARVVRETGIGPMVHKDLESILGFENRQMALQREYIESVGWVTREYLLKQAPGEEHTGQVDKSYANLLRMWSDV